MSFISAFIIVNIFFSILCTTITSLPVTSKPIENTPEHLAWEAWIMVPSSYDKTRKITPKSIFIVPNGTNNGLNSNYGNDKHPTFLPQIQCPSGYTVHNSKCIPTVSIDQSQILITRLASLIPSTDKYNGTNDDIVTNYDYDYEYDTYDADESQSLTINHNNNGGDNENKNPPLSSSSSDYNGEPLKINLSLEKLPPLIQNDEEKEKNNDDGDDIVKKIDVNITENIPPDVIVAIKNENEQTDDERLFDEKPLSLTISDLSVTQIPKLDDESSIFKRNSTPSEIIVTTSTTTANKIDDFLKISNSSDKSSSENKIMNKKKNIPILSPSETEILTTINSNTNSTTSIAKDSNEFDLDNQETTHTIATTTTENGIELVTNSDDIKNTSIEDEIKNYSFILDETNSKTTVSEISDSTENQEQILTTTPLNLEPEDNEDKTTIPNFEDNISLDTTTTAATTITTMKTLKSVVNSAATIKGNLTAITTNQTSTTSNASSLLKSEDSTETPNDAAPLMEAIESNNRYIYHHLGTTNSVLNPYLQRKTTETSTTPTTDIREQLRIINKIVEENKKRAAAASNRQTSSSAHYQFQNSKIRFPDDTRDQTNSNHYPEYSRSDFIKFPTDVHSSSPQLASVSPILHKPPSDSLNSFHRYLQQLPQPSPSQLSSSQQTSFISPTNNNGNIQQQNSKPFWWLPTGWEVDRTGDRPMMVRFWSRIPIEPSSTSSSSSSNLNHQHHQHNNHQKMQISARHPSSLTTPPTTSGYRENSRSPTENLYRQEILTHQEQQRQQRQQKQQQQQDGIYSILRAKQWKHNDR